jgi:hypothetical protein
MRFVHAALFLAGSAMPALAQHEPVIVVPGRPDVPVLLNGYDIRGAVVEGDWGLERPGHVAPTIVDGPLIPAPYYDRGYIPYGPGSYYPATGRRPGYGRLEIQPPPNRMLPPPAPSYHRNWSIQSEPGPVTDYAPYNVPSAVVVPDRDRRDGDQDDGQGGLDGSQPGGQSRPDRDRHDADDDRHDDRHHSDQDHHDGQHKFDDHPGNRPRGVAHNQGRGKHMPRHVR